MSMLGADTTSKKPAWPVFMAKQQSRQEVAEGTMAFCFEKPAGWTFVAGQFIDLTLIAPPETDAEGNTRGFSIASAPFETTIMIATRLRNTAFKRVLKMLPLGTESRSKVRSAICGCAATRCSRLSYCRAASGSRRFEASSCKPRTRSGPGASSFSTGIGGPKIVESLETFYLRKRTTLKRVSAVLVDERAPPEEEVLPRDTMYQGKRQSPRNWQGRAEEAGEARHAERLAIYEAIRALQEKGADIAHIARTVGVSRRTVYRCTRMDGPPERARPGPRPGNRVLAPYEPYLLQRWNEGCHNGVKLWHEIQEQGFAYSVTNVARFLAHLRREGKLPHPVGKTGTTVSTPQGPTARRVAFLCIAHGTDLEEEDSVYLERLRAEDAFIERAYQVVQDFMHMLHDHQGERLDGWIEVARDSGIGELQRFAAGLVADHAAVQAGLTLTWSNGQVEGQVNRLKLLKRQMYGRANFDLLRQRILHAA